MTRYTLGRDRAVVHASTVIKSVWSLCKIRLSTWPDAQTTRRPVTCPICRTHLSAGPAIYLNTKRRAA